MTDNNIYRFNVPMLNGLEESLSAYKNKVLLIVNTASQCGFTPQMKELVELKNEFAGLDFEILAFPSNDFGGQEPLEGAGIIQFCESYSSNFHFFDKIRVRGPYAHPLYKFFADKKQNGILSSVPRWNFHKFLVNRLGVVTDFFYPFTKPTSSKIRKKIGRLVNEI
nr:glutathione peroxidase [uncultured Mucilaginibacter sp.]